MFSCSHEKYLAWWPVLPSVTVFGRWCSRRAFCQASFPQLPSQASRSHPLLFRSWLRRVSPFPSPHLKLTNRGSKSRVDLFPPFSHTPLFSSSWCVSFLSCINLSPCPLFSLALRLSHFFIFSFPLSPSPLLPFPEKQSCRIVPPFRSFREVDGVQAHS